MAAFRFALQASKAASPDAWRDLARQAADEIVGTSRRRREELGFRSIVVPEAEMDAPAPVIADLAWT